MTVRSFVLLVSVVANLLVFSYLALLAAQRLPTAIWRPQGPRAECPQTVCSAATAAPLCPAPICPEPAPTRPPPTAASESPPRTKLQRLVICEQATASPRMRSLHWSEPAAAALAVHCGDTVHVLGFDPAGPRRMLRITKPVPNPQLRARSAEVLAADVSGDGLNDLIVGFAWTDATGAARGGALLELVRERSGGFTAPRVLAPMHVAGLAAGTFDDQPGADLAVLHRADTQRDQQNELVLLHGGPSPLKWLSKKTRAADRQVDLVDLDLDGHPELVLSGDDEPPHSLVLGPTALADVPDPFPNSSDPSHKVLVADLDADGHDDVILYGSKLTIVFSTSGAPRAPLPVLEGMSANQLTALDLDHDGKLDLVAANADAVVGLAQTFDSHFEARPIAALRERDFVCDGLAALSSVSGSSRVALLGHRAQLPQRIELVLVSSDADVGTEWESESKPVDEASLAYNLIVP